MYKKPKNNRRFLFFLIDLFNLVNVPKLQTLNVYSYPKIANLRQFFSAECIDSLRAVIPTLTTVIYERARDVFVSYILPTGVHAIFKQQMQIHLEPFVICLNMIHALIVLF